MFDFNLKPIPKAEPTQLSNSGSYTSSMNPQLVPTPSLLRNDNRRNTKANLPLGDGNGFFLSPYSPMGSKKSSTIQTDSNTNTNTLKFNQERKGNLQSSINDTSMLPLNPSLEKLVELWEQHPDLIKDGLKEKGIKAWVEDGMFYLHAGESTNYGRGNNQITKKSSTVYILSEDGLSIPITTAILQDDNLRVSIPNIKNPMKENVFSLIFKGNEIEGWRLDIPNFLEPIIIPPKIPIDQVSGLFIGFWIGLQMANSNKQPISKRDKDGAQILGGRKPKIGLVENSPCFTHDYGCDLQLFGRSPITRDGRLYLWFPCGGTLEINVLDCCRKHDIDLWCSRDRSAAESADKNVILCVMSEVVARATSEGGFFCDIANMLFFYAIYWPVIKLAYTAATFANIFHEKNTMNLDGRNSLSCLCGGTQNTYSCTNPCLNLCHEEGLDSKTNCVRCTYDCQYDANGRVIGNRRTLNSYGRPPEDCCQDTLEFVFDSATGRFGNCDLSPI